MVRTPGNAKLTSHITARIQDLGWTTPITDLVNLSVNFEFWDMKPRVLHSPKTKERAQTVHPIGSG